MCWKLKIWSYFSRCTDCTQMVHTESTETNCWYAKQAANTPTPDVFWLCLTICHFNVAQDTHLCPTNITRYINCHYYPFIFALLHSTLPANYPRVVTFLVLICVSTQRNNRAESVSPLISGGWKILLSHLKSASEFNSNIFTRLSSVWFSCTREEGPFFWLHFFPSGF